MKPFVFSGGERTPQIESSLGLFPLCKGVLMDAGCVSHSDIFASSPIIADEVKIVHCLLSRDFYVAMVHFYFT